MCLLEQLINDAQIFSGQQSSDALEPQVPDYIGMSRYRIVALRLVFSLF